MRNANNVRERREKETTGRNRDPLSSPAIVSRKEVESAQQSTGGYGLNRPRLSRDVRFWKTDRTTYSNTKVSSIMKSWGKFHDETWEKRILRE
jgi:hypothetical protein